jgi:hypothetical protein
MMSSRYEFSMGRLWYILGEIRMEGLRINTTEPHDIPVSVIAPYIFMNRCYLTNAVVKASVSLLHR